MPQALTDTICAISTPPGQATRGLIRLSGAQTDTVLKQVLVAVPKDVRTLVAARLARPLPEIPCLVTRFAAPHSFTGQDSAELLLPGHPVLLERVLAQMTRDTLLCRRSEPGEFTWRAFRSGKLTLEQVEGLAATLQATTEQELLAAAELRHGTLSKRTAKLADQLAMLLALTEAGVDFSEEEDVVPIDARELRQQIQHAQEALHDLLNLGRTAARTCGRPRVLLLGPPSSGKSTLVNALTGQVRVLTDAAPGTTRDLIEVPHTLRSPDAAQDILLVDSAGLAEQAVSHLDAHAQELVRRAIDTADLIVQLGDIPHLLPASRVLQVHTKSDLTPAPDGQMAICAPKGEGLDALQAAIAERLAQSSGTTGATTLTLLPRHLEALQACDDTLADLAATLAQLGDQGLDDAELVASQLRTALDTLAPLVGHITPDEVIGKVFSSFCVGK